VQGWNGPYLRGGSVPQDPWGRQYRYVSDGRTFQISSMGPDGSGAAAPTR